jgi:hypothetical protein
MELRKSRVDCSRIRAGGDDRDDPTVDDKRERLQDERTPLAAIP